MTTQNNLPENAGEDVNIDLFLYGMSILKVYHTGKGVEVKRVPIEEYKELADYLKYVADNSVKLSKNTSFTKLMKE